MDSGLWQDYYFFLSDAKFMGRVFNLIMQGDLLRFAVVKLLVFAPLFNTQEKHVTNLVDCTDH